MSKHDRHESDGDRQPDFIFLYIIFHLTPLYQLHASIRTNLPQEFMKLVTCFRENDIFQFWEMQLPFSDDMGYAEIAIYPPKSRFPMENL